MKTWIVEYSTNLDDRKTETIAAETYTDAYVKFSVKSPNYYIVSITEK